MHSWMAGLLFANMPFKSAVGICNRDSARNIFFFVLHGLFVFLKHKWLIRQYFWCLFKETYSKKERKMYFVNRLKSWAPIRLLNQTGKARVDAIQNTCLWATQTWLQSMLDGNTNMLSPKFAFVYLGHVLTLGRTPPSAPPKTVGMTKPHRPTQEDRSMNWASQQRWS